MSPPSSGSNNPPTTAGGNLSQKQVQRLETLRAEGRRLGSLPPTGANLARMSRWNQKVERFWNQVVGKDNERS